MISFGLLALGGNLPSQFGSSIETLKVSLKHLNRNGIHLAAVSRFFQTPCFPAGNGPDYINAAVAIKTELRPEALLAQLHAIEAEFGRKRDLRWGTRPLDLDLLACDNLVLPSAPIWTHWRDLPMDQQTQVAPEELILPHPRLQDRSFVLAPLMDIAAGWKHPEIGLTVAQMFAQLPENIRDEPRPL